MKLFEIVLQEEQGTFLLKVRRLRLNTRGMFVFCGSKRQNQVDCR